MTAPFCTTTATLLRGSGVDSYYDAVDNTSIAASGVPVSIIEQSVDANPRRSGSTPRTIRRYTMRWPTWATPVLDGDRIRDERTGVIYPVVQVATPQRVLAGATQNVTLVRNT